MLNHELIDTRYGKMWVFADDPGCSRMLKEYGEFSELEVATIAHYLPADGTVLDIGANIGALTLPLAKIAKKVIAFEPQDEVRMLLERNIELAGLTNVEVMPYALGFKQATAYYSQAASFWADSPGSVPMLEKPVAGAKEVQMVMLDSFHLQPDFIKLDVEGMEVHVLAGGAETIKAHRPTMLVERPYDPETERLQIDLLAMLGYYISRMDFPLFVANNWKQNKKDLVPALAHMMQIAIPNQKYRPV